MIEFFTLATKPAVVKRSLMIAAIVGVIIAIINYYDKIMGFSLTGTEIAKIALTFFVPYAVSTISAVLAAKDRQKDS